MQRTGGADPRNMIGGNGWQNPNAPTPQTGMAALPRPAQMNIMQGQNAIGGGMPQTQQIEQPAMAPPAAPQANPQMAAIAQALMAQQAPQAPQMPPMMQGQGMQMNRGMGMSGLRRPMPTRAY
jgi:hypothetical protein